MSWGLRKLKEARLIQNTPRSTVRGAAMGLVELAGEAKARTVLTSPIQKIPCCWWRCVVQEYQRSGKSSRWVTLREIDPCELFYLKDETGEILVNPQGSEKRVRSRTFQLSSSTRTLLSPVLQSWGFNDMNWFGGSRSLRIREEVIPEGSPLFMLGELITLQTHSENRQTALNNRLREIKKDARAMAAADTNQDGTLDSEEWDALRAKLENDLIREELARPQPQGPKTIIVAPASNPFVIAVGAEADWLGPLKWLVPLAVFGGIALIGVGVWIGVSQHWPLPVLGGIAGGGFVLGHLTRFKGVSLWQRFY